jgi:hypothetical protein
MKGGVINLRGVIGRFTKGLKMKDFSDAVAVGEKILEG